MAHTTLINIINHTPIKLKEDTTYYDPQKQKMYVLRGKAEKYTLRWLLRPNTTLWSPQDYLITMNVHCDGMPETLIHEALHVKYPWMQEHKVRYLTLIYWSQVQDVRDAAQSRVVKELVGYEE